MDVGIVAQRDNERAVALADRLRERLGAEGVAVAVDESTASALGDGDTGDDSGVPVVAAAGLDGCDLVVSIGGDGTFLYAARGAGSTPIVGVNLGEVGFLNAVAPADAEEAVLDAVERARGDGDPTTATLPRVAAAGEDWTLAPAANEVLVHGPRRGHGGGGTFTVSVDGDTYASGLADGVIVATPTGSTAYNLSEDGPIVHPAVDALVLTTMAGADAMPPLVLDDDSSVTVTLEDAPSGVAVSDGRVRQPLEPPTTVTVERADAPLRVAGPPRDFFGALDKLR